MKSKELIAAEARADAAEKRAESVEAMGNRLAARTARLHDLVSQAVPLLKKVTARCPCVDGCADCATEGILAIMCAEELALAQPATEGKAGKEG